MTWDSETIAKARALWDEGISTAEIGRRMGFSKNSVLSMAHRKGFMPRPSPIRRADASAPKPAPVLNISESARAAASIVALPAQIKISAPIPLPSRRCVWTDGAPGAWLCCDEPVARGCFCAGHAGRGYVARPQPISVNL